MVGIVIVSHSQKLAEGVKELAEMMANNVHIEAAGGLDEGLLGTSYERVKVAIEDVCGTDGAVVLMDMGSAVMTAEPRRLPNRRGRRARGSRCGERGRP